MTFKFQVGETVALKKGRTAFLPAGARGIVFCQYTTKPTAYEVNFQDIQGKEFGAFVSEDEIELMSESEKATGLANLAAKAA